MILYEIKSYLNECLLLSVLQFPSMTSLQAELPGAGLQHVSSYDSHSRGLMASQPIPFSSATSPSNIFILPFQSHKCFHFIL